MPDVRINKMGAAQSDQVVEQQRTTSLEEDRVKSKKPPKLYMPPPDYSRTTDLEEISEKAETESVSATASDEPSQKKAS